MSDNEVFNLIEWICASEIFTDLAAVTQPEDRILVRSETMDDNLLLALEFHDLEIHRTILFAITG